MLHEQGQRDGLLPPRNLLLIIKKRNKGAVARNPETNMGMEVQALLAAFRCLLKWSWLFKKGFTGVKK